MYWDTAFQNVFIHCISLNLLEWFIAIENPSNVKWLKATTGGPRSSSSQAFNLFSVKQSPHKPM